MIYSRKLYFIQQQWAYGGMSSKIKEKSGDLGFRGLKRVCILISEVQSPRDAESRLKKGRKWWGIYTHNVGQNVEIM